MTGSRHWARGAALGLALALGLAAFGALATAAAAQQQVPASQAQIQLSFAPVVKKAAPAVVNIYAKKLVKRRVGAFAGDPFFEGLFRGMAPRGRRVENILGSGVLVRADGLVITNNHVVGGASEIRVVLSDRREFAAEILLADEASDLAVLRLDGASDLPVLALRDSNTLEVGDLVLAIGNPFGVGQTVTSGIVSGLARSGIGGPGRQGYFIQTDAAINPGNSGGALVDMQGRLVGVNTVILTRSGGSNGIGFAVPSNLVAQVAAQAELGRSTLARPWAGLEGQPVDDALAEALGLEAPEGLVIGSTHPLSPFVAAGLETGDVLVAIGGQRVQSPAELNFRLASLGVGAETELSYVHDGEPRIARMRLIAPPEDPPRDARRLRADGPFAGIVAAMLNPALADEIGAPLSARGVAVIAVSPRARRAGFRPGDVVLEVNGAKIGHPDDLVEAAAQRRRNWRVLIERKGRRGVLGFRG